MEYAKAGLGPEVTLRCPGTIPFIIHRCISEVEIEAQQAAVLDFKITVIYFF